MKRRAVRNSMCSARSASRGVTLVELLIAVSLVAVISTGMLVATRTSLLTYEKTRQRLESNRESVNVVDILNRQLNSLIPAMADCPNASGTSTALPLFVGTPSSLRAVSQFSIAEGTRGYPQILEYLVAPSPSGGLRLIVNEIPYTGPSSASSICRGNSFFPVEVKAQSFVLADRLSSCVISYHNPLDFGLTESGWSPDWLPPNAPLSFPPAVRIDLRPLDGPRPGEFSQQLPLYSVTVPIRTDRAFQEQYVQ